MNDPYSILHQIDAPYVLDAATGRGDFINILKQNLRSYIQITGVDASEKSVAHAQKMFPENDVEIYQMNLEDLQFDDSSFDLVTLSNSLHHLENVQAVFAELLRVLKPGGLLMINEMYKDGEQTEPQQTHIMMHHWLAAIDRRFGVFHRETYTREEIQNLVKGLKLKKLSVSDFYEPVDNPKEARNCEHLKRNCSDTFKRIETLEDADELLDEGKELLDRIMRVGCASASRLLITGIKPAPKTAKP
jgi:ubiquinone/menaquinone biosynthesis C-methylase UbiE